MVELERGGGVMLPASPSEAVGSSVLACVEQWTPTDESAAGNW